MPDRDRKQADHQPEVRFGDLLPAPVDKVRLFSMAFQIAPDTKSAGQGVRIRVVVALDHDPVIVQKISETHIFFPSFLRDLSPGPASEVTDNTVAHDECNNQGQDQIADKEVPVTMR